MGRWEETGKPRHAGKTPGRMRYEGNIGWRKI